MNRKLKHSLIILALLATLVVSFGFDCAPRPYVYCNHSSSIWFGELDAIVIQNAIPHTSHNNLILYFKNGYTFEADVGEIEITDKLTVGNIYMVMGYCPNEDYTQYAGYWIYKMDGMPTVTYTTDNITYGNYHKVKCLGNLNTH